MPPSPACLQEVMLGEFIRACPAKRALGGDGDVTDQGEAPEKVGNEELVGPVHLQEAPVEQGWVGTVRSGSTEDIANMRRASGEEVI